LWEVSNGYCRFSIERLRQFDFIDTMAPPQWDVVDMEKNVMVAVFDRWAQCHDDPAHDDLLTSTPLINLPSFRFRLA
jgi:hypothetical protein